MCRNENKMMASSTWQLPEAYVIYLDKACNKTIVCFVLTLRVHDISHATIVRCFKLGPNCKKRFENITRFL